MLYEMKCIKDRDTLILQLYEFIINSSITDNFMLYGAPGSGKKHVVHNLVLKLHKHKDVTVLKFIDDQLVELWKKYKAKESEFTLSLSIYAGIAWGIKNKNNSKVTYLVNSLKAIPEDRILIVIPHLDKVKSEVRNIISTITDHKDFFEQQTGKKIFVVATSSHFNTDSVYKGIRFYSYSKNDVCQHLKQNHNYDILTIDSWESKLDTLCSVCNYDLNLVNLIYRDLFEKGADFEISLKVLIKERLHKIQQTYNDKYLSSEDLEEIILTCALCAEYFSRFQIGIIHHCDENIILKSFNIYEQEHIIDRVSATHYDFISPEIKKHLANAMYKKNHYVLIDYYNYLTEYRTDEYYLRFFYLMKFYGKIDEQFISILILALSKAFLFNDSCMVEKIKNVLSEYGEPAIYDKWFCYIFQAYEYYQKRNYTHSIEMLDMINFELLDTVAKAELYRLLFRNYYMLRDTDSFKCNSCINKLLHYVNDTITIKTNYSNIKRSDEYILKLQIIYDISPCILDTKNEYTTFQNLYDLSNKILRKEKEGCRETKTSQYISNIFNRKAFLFINPMQSMVYYDEAKTFFSKNGIWDEYCITNICEAGTLLACGQYQQALNLCEVARNIASKYSICIPTPEKLLNNELIAEFLLKENEEDLVETKQHAKHIAEKLVDVSSKLDASGTKHVMLTNAASLFLYSSEYDRYNQIKQTIEHSLLCDDVSDISDDTVNDFYRYHFAWFELYYNLQKEKWDLCKYILNSLNGFIPALFKRQESIWCEKNEAVAYIINNKTVPNAYDFSNKLVDPRRDKKYGTSFYHRGLMLSDIQYTSYN